MTDGLILAAGAGTRFGKQPKLLSLLNGRPLLTYAVTAMCAVEELERIVVVLGAEADKLLAAVTFGRAEPIVCPDWSDGLAASLGCGIAALVGSERIVVTLGDSPTTTPAVIRRLLGASGVSRACYFGRPGHPVLLERGQLERVGLLSGDVGARDLIGHAAMIECGDLASGRDVDTASDLKEIGGEAMAHRLM